MKWILCLVVIGLMPFVSIAQKKATIRGTIVQKNTNQPIANVSLILTENGIGTLTDSSGKYQMLVPMGSYLMEISHQTYFKKYQKVNIKADMVLDFVLDEKVNELEEVRISANSSEQNVKRLGTGVTNLNIRTLKKLPSLLGEIDIIKSLYTLPGVTSVGEGASGFNVRGGNIDQNLILLDEAPIFNSSHLMGFFSVFNPDAFRDFNFYRGGIPAQYGGRISSVLNVNLKDANATKFSVSGGVGTISSRLLIETPIVKDKLSIYVAGRVSYIDQMLKVVKIKKLAGSKANFYDLTGKLEYKLSNKDRISLSAFQGRDQFRLAKDSVSAIDENGDALYDWQTTNATGSWSHYFGSKFSAKLIGVYSKYNADIINSDSSTAFNLNYNINYKSIKGIAVYNPNEKHELEFGFQVNRYDIQPGLMEPTLETSNKNRLALNKESGIESAIFINDKIEISKKFNLGVGVRYVSYQALGAATVYTYEDSKPRNIINLVDSVNYNKGEVVASYGSFEPRFSLNYNFNTSSSFKLSANRMRQFIQLLSGTTAALPTDRWKLSDTYIKPQMSDQFSMGYFKNFKEKSLESSLELFYKKLYNVVDYKDGETLLLNPFPETAILQGNGYAYGAEFYVKKNLGVLTGWLSYTYSQTRIKVKGPTEEETINNGEYFPPIFNRPHSFNAIGSYQVSKKVSFSSNLNFSSGRAITYPASKFYYSGAVLPYYNSRNQSQIPNYLRLDLAMNVESHPYRTSGYRGSWNVSLYNVMGRKNAYSVFFRAKNPYNQFYSKVNIYKLSVLGSIIPSVAYNFKF
ncbi:TonB-dependent receptor [Lacihabitans sp. LS3-19]|uniref:TonB-dependent receptor n=1 Tax=Lacihabitans sp. LS3-19 TaxID=2487335 RepID=UPI0020CF6B8D|nr:TonB-dependent receptor [Lacihabitans sp. LS3-19]MCP9770803.1 TonB-dependent receptor [Lacihabitans sp. LS3-19]